MHYSHHLCPLFCISTGSLAPRRQVKIFENTGIWKEETETQHKTPTRKAAIQAQQRSDLFISQSTHVLCWNQFLYKLLLPQQLGFREHGRQPSILWIGKPSRCYQGSKDITWGGRKLIYKEQEERTRLLQHRSWICKIVSLVPALINQLSYFPNQCVTEMFSISLISN